MRKDAATPASARQAETRQVTVAPREAVTARLYPARTERRAGVALILAHGAGAGQASPFMVRCAADLASRGIDAVTFNFLYTEHGRRLPDRNDRLEACWRAVIAAMRAEPSLAGSRLAIGGKSMGGRIASQVAAGGDVGDLAGLVFLGYPLHPPGRPERLRSAHLPRIVEPMLFVQGERDSFGTPDELAPIIAALAPRAELYVVAGGDHSFKRRKSDGLSQAEAESAVQNKVERWLRQRVA
ncbi:MAG TPA: alpha/beta family hydrolase [Stellaceae bacterium]